MYTSLGFDFLECVWDQHASRKHTAGQQAKEAGGSLEMFRWYSVAINILSSAQLLISPCQSFTFYLGVTHILLKRWQRMWLWHREDLTGLHTQSGICTRASHFIILWEICAFEWEFYKTFSMAYFYNARQGRNRCSEWIDRGGVFK